MSALSATALELAVLTEFCKQLPPPDRAALEEQIEGISVRSRENIGAGFFTYFDLAAKPMQKIQADTTRCYVHAKINGVEEALGFILWLTDGYVDNLEGYSMSMTDTEGLDLAALEFELVSAPPFSD